MLATLLAGVVEDWSREAEVWGVVVGPVVGPAVIVKVETSVTVVGVVDVVGIWRLVAWVNDVDVWASGEPVVVEPDVEDRVVA